MDRNMEQGSDSYEYKFSSLPAGQMEMEEEEEEEDLSISETESSSSGFSETLVFNYNETPDTGKGSLKWASSIGLGSDGKSSDKKYAAPFWKDDDDPIRVLNQSRKMSAIGSNTDEEEDDAEEMHALARNKRLTAKEIFKREKDWRAKMIKMKHTTNLGRFKYFWKKVPILGRSRLLLLYLVFLAAIIVCWQIFAWLFPGEYWGDVQLYIFFRLVAVYMVLFLVLVVLVRYFMYMLSLLMQERPLIQWNNFCYSIALIIFGIISIPTYNVVAENQFNSACNVTSQTTLYADGSLEGIGCITADWFFVSSLIVGILWLLRTCGEELLLAKADIRPSSTDISIALLKEYYLHKLVKYMRKSGILLKRGDPSNKLPNLDLRCNSLNEARLLDMLEESHEEFGRFSDRFTVFDNRRRGLKSQCVAMFAHLDTAGKGYLTREDFRVCFHRRTTRGFLVFDILLNEKIDLPDFINAVDSIYFTRQQIWDSYRDRLEIALVLTHLLGVVFWLIMIVVVLLLASVSINTVIIPIASLLLGFSFAFGSQVSLMFESFVLILFTRPFDVGDKIQFGFGSGNFFVYKMGLYRTILYTADGRYFSVPNQHLTGEKVSNMHRSKAYTFSLDLVVSSSTPANALLAFKTSLEAYLKGNPSDYNADGCLVYLDKILDMNKIVIGLWIEFRSIGWEAFVDQSGVKLELILFIQRQAKILGITYSQIPLPVDLTETTTKKKKKKKGSIARHSNVPTGFMAEQEHSYSSGPADDPRRPERGPSHLKGFVGSIEKRLSKIRTHTRSGSDWKQNLPTVQSEVPPNTDSTEQTGESRSLPLIHIVEEEPAGPIPKPPPQPPVLRTLASWKSRRSTNNQ